eukprot:301775-Amphidinium_carterae.1
MTTHEGPNQWRPTEVLRHATCGLPVHARLTFLRQVKIGDFGISKVCPMMCLSNRDLDSGELSFLDSVSLVCKKSCFFQSFGSEP